MKNPLKRRANRVAHLSGTLDSVWVDNDRVDILVYGVLHTRDRKNRPVDHVLTLAVDPDLAPAIADLIGQEAAQIDATGDAIDDHDQALDRAADLDVA